MLNLVVWLGCIFVCIGHCSTQNLPVSVISSIIFPSKNTTIQPVCEVQQSDFLIDTMIPMCAVPVGNLTSGNDATGSQPREDGGIPPWINLTLALQGQLFANNYLTAIGSSHISGLIMSIQFPSMRDILLFTQNSDTPGKSVMRYAATMIQVILWYEDFFIGQNDSNTFTSLNNVRKLHISASERVSVELIENQTLVNEAIYSNTTLNTAMWSAFATDLKNSSIPQSSRTYNFSNSNNAPINQFQLSMTQFAFVGIPVAFSDRIGITATDDELWAFNHLWAILGYLLGIDDKYNIALQPNLTAAKQYYEQIFNEYYLPLLFNVEFTTKVLVEALLQGLELMVPPFPPNLSMYRLLKYVIQIPAPNMYKQLNATEQRLESLWESQDFRLFQTDPIYRNTINLAAKSYIANIGFKYYGSDYATKKSQAKYVYYA